MILAKRYLNIKIGCIYLKYISTNFIVTYTRYDEITRSRINKSLFSVILNEIRISLREQNSISLLDNRTKRVTVARRWFSHAKYDSYVYVARPSFRRTRGYRGGAATRWDGPSSSSVRAEHARWLAVETRKAGLVPGNRVHIVGKHFVGSYSLAYFARKKPSELFRSSLRPSEVTYYRMKTKFDTN